MRKAAVKYSEEIADEICDAIANSEHGLPYLCKNNPHWPDRMNIYRWRVIHPEFAQKFMIAKQHQVEVLVDEILQIADDDSQDVNLTSEGKKFVDHGHVNRARLRVETRKWVAGKLSPRLYGDKKPEPKEDNQYLMQQIIDKIDKPA